MPFLRVLRDKRGYETSYLMHWFREGNRQRSRVLYVFRSPGGVRVGRTPLDRDILREIERLHPDIEFDWKAVRENQQVIEASPERRRRPRREEPDAEVAAPEAPRGGPEEVEAPVSAPVVAPARPAIPTEVEGATPDEQIAFLERWYPVLRDRVAHRSDPERQDALQALVERLNPAAWTDADQITSGLQSAAEALERLARVLSRRRRRGRRRPVPGNTETPGREDVGASPAEEPGADTEA